MWHPQDVPSVASCRVTTCPHATEQQGTALGPAERETSRTRQHDTTLVLLDLSFIYALSQLSDTWSLNSAVSDLFGSMFATTATYTATMPHTPTGRRYEHGDRGRVCSGI